MEGSNSKVTGGGAPGRRAQKHPKKHPQKHQRWDRSRYPLLIFSGPVFRFVSYLANRLTQILGWILVAPFYVLTPVGHKYLPAGPAVLASNHTMYLDPLFILCSVFPRSSFFTGQTSHFSVPIGGTILRFMRSFPIPVENPIKRLIPTAANIFARGLYMHMFVEGRMRLRRQVLQPFRIGAFDLAVRFNIPVVPIALVIRYHRVFGWRLPYPPHVKVVFLEPVYPEDVSPDYVPREANKHVATQLRDRCHTLVQAAIVEHRGEDLLEVRRRQRRR